MTEGETPALTEGQRRVVRELARDGASNREIAARLFVTERTVKWHLANASHTAGVQSRTALALWWIRHGQHQETPRWSTPTTSSRCR